MPLTDTHVLAITRGPFRNLLEVLSLSPDYIGGALVFLGLFVIFNELVRSALMAEFTRSVFTHLAINVMTLLPAVLIALVLLFAAYRHPGRAWINLVFALLL